VNVFLHPNADNNTTVSNNTEYKATVAPYTYSRQPVDLSIFLGTPPSSVTIKDALHSRMASPSVSFVGKNLDSKYFLNESGGRNILTVLFPHSASHLRASMSRITGSGYTGANIDLSNSITDTALASTGINFIRHQGVSLKGFAVLYRQRNGKTSSYFVCKGTSCDDGASVRRGFTSIANVSIYIKGLQGKIISSKTDVTFYSPGITSVKIDGLRAPIISAGNG